MIPTEVMLRHLEPVSFLPPLPQLCVNYMQICSNFTVSQAFHFRWALWGLLNILSLAASQGYLKSLLPQFFSGSRASKRNIHWISSCSSSHSDMNPPPAAGKTMQFHQPNWWDGNAFRQECYTLIFYLMQWEFFLSKNFSSCCLPLVIFQYP